MGFRTFQSRVVVSFLLVITLVQIGSLIAVNSALERSARAHVKAELATAAKVVGILLVEDNEMVRALTCEVLRGHGYTVLEARHGADALDITQRYHGPIHLLLTDVVMPELGGRELARRLTPGRPGMKVLYMSGYAADAIVHQGELAAGEAFLSKPIKADTLSWKVREVLDGRPEPRH